MQKNIVAFLCAVCFSPISFSQTIGELREKLSQIEQQIAVMQQENILLQTQITNQENKKRMSQYLQDENTGPLPSVVSIARVDAIWAAKLQGQDGVIATYSVGDEPQKNVKIIAISNKGVVVSIGKAKQIKNVSLQFKNMQSGASGSAAIGSSSVFWGNQPQTANAQMPSLPPSLGNPLPPPIYNNR